MKKLLLVIILLTFFTSFTTLAPGLSKETKEAKELNKQNERDFNDLMNAEFSETNLRKLLLILDVDHVETVIKQTKLETGWYKSRLFVYHNNLFGMHFPKIRETYSDRYTIADNGAKCASYASWQSSVFDYVLYIDYYKSFGYDISDYNKFLVDVNFCEKGSYYIELLNKMS